MCKCDEAMGCYCKLNVANCWSGPPSCPVFNNPDVYFRRKSQNKTF